MKFKVGDKVKIRKNLKINKPYNDAIFVERMAKYKGKEATIVNITYNDIITLDIDDEYWNWSEGMLEKVEITKAELQSEIDKLENSNRKLYSKVTSNRDKIENLKREIMSLKENDKSILDEKEKKYLLGVIKPFKKNVKYIEKIIDNSKECCEYIKFYMNRYEDNFGLPSFKKETMYKGMELDKRYTLKELGLDE